MKNKRESGELVVEASIVVTIVLIFITAMLYIGMILYQQTLTTAIANQTAANIAYVYSNSIKDPFTGYVESDDVYQSVTYSNMKTDAYMEVMTRKANIFAKYRLKSARILNTGNPRVEVEIVDKPNELLKSQVVVVIQDSYELPLAGFFGVSDIMKFHASGRADCVDILEYINGVEAVGKPSDGNISPLPDSDTCTVTFIADPRNPAVVGAASVFRGKSILSSHAYTNSVMPANPVWKNYEFAGWVTENGSAFTATTIVNQNMIVYGSWKVNITLDAAGGTVNGQPSITLKVKAGSRVSLPNAVRDGYNFGGWYTAPNGQGSKCVSNDTIFEENITLYAAWTCNHSGSTGYQFVEKVGYWCVDNPYNRYRCQRCGAEYRTSVEGVHNTNGRCNVLHNKGAKFIGTCGTHNPGYGKYHVTCTGCGRVATSTGHIYVGNKYFEYWYWCGKHGKNRPVTQTH